MNPTSALAPATSAVHSSLQLESVHLRVHDLARSVAFYVGQLGFVRVPDGADASLSTARLAVAADAPAILELTEDRTAAPAPRDTAGLFHAALLLPSRAALGRWLARAAAAQTSFDGFADHGVSEAIYLADPDGNGLEFYVDRPRDAWPYRNGELAMITAPLNVRDLLSAGSSAEADAPLLAGARWGHLHLRVSDLDRAQEFYTRQLGLTLTQRFGPSARFLAADGYHHHVGLNTWGGVCRPQTPGALGLIEATFSVPTVAAPSTQRDPDGIALSVVPASLTSSL